MISFKIFFKKLKFKKNPIENLYENEKFNQFDVLRKHYLAERVDVNTLDGKGNIYTTITHHNNDYVPKECQGKHIITPTQKDITNIHPNKTGTLSNDSFFVPEDLIRSEINKDSNDVLLEFTDKKSILSRIDEQNMEAHLAHNLTLNNKKLLNIKTNTLTEEIDPLFQAEEEELQSIKANKEADCFTILIHKIKSED